MAGDTSHIEAFKAWITRMGLSDNTMRRRAFVAGRKSGIAKGLKISQGLEEEKAAAIKRKIETLKDAHRFNVTSMSPADVHAALVDIAESLP